MVDSFVVSCAFVKLDDLVFTKPYCEFALTSATLVNCPAKPLGIIFITNLTVSFAKAASYLEQLYAMRSQAFSEIQRKHAQNPRDKDPLSKLLAILISRKPDISAAEAISQLESGNYADVIIDFDEDMIEYSHPDGRIRCVNKSAIPARLSRLRKK